MVACLRLEWSVEFAIVVVGLLDIGQVRFIACGVGRKGGGR